MCEEGNCATVARCPGQDQIDVDETKSTVWYYAGNEYVVPTDQWTEIFNRHKVQTDKEHDITAVGGLHIFGTERHGGSTTSCAAAPAARAIPAPLASICRSKMT